MGRQLIGQGQGKPLNRDKFPNVDPMLHRGLLVDPPMFTLKEIQDGTYSIEDILLINELLDLKQDCAPKSKGK